MTKTPLQLEQNQLDIEHDIRTLAHQFWEEDGKPEGKAEEHWNRACLVMFDLDAGDKPEREPEWLKRNEAAGIAKTMANEKVKAKTESISEIEEIRQRIVSRTAA